MIGHSSIYNALFLLQVAFSSNILQYFVLPCTDIVSSFQLIVFSLPSIIALFMATFGVCHSVPPTAPSSSAHEVSASFFIGMKEV